MLGNTYGMLVLQDFEALTPNLLARTVETVEGGGIVVLLLSSLDSLTQLYSLTMDVHARLRTESHQEVKGQRDCAGTFCLVWQGERRAGEEEGRRAVLALHTCFGTRVRLLDPPTSMRQPRHAGRFNERLVLSLACNPNCIMMDDELNILPSSTLVRCLCSVCVGGWLGGGVGGVSGCEGGRLWMCVRVGGWGVDVRGAPN